MAATATTKIAGNGYTGGAGYTAILDPTVDNSIDAAFLVGDVITNTVTGSVFRCVDNTTGAAVWHLLDVIEASYTWNPNSAANQTFYVAQRACTVLGILFRVDIQGSDGGAVTGTVVKAASGTAMSSGTALHTAAVNLKLTTATNSTVTLAAAGTLAIAAGTSLGFQTSGTMTAAIGCVTVLLLPS